ncbi:RsfA family transcriptional regulator [Bacillus sp. MUM 13]|uniref:RsfA family transcriptional regulator n=1 Tax=Bacillus sp. MUM 13 TaxID=1678001 RepID=UPI0008F5E40B|nr:RsfA family transcriptional regulator [Bacillus sp. MUM 13]OIK06466.1 hypothetical protein BIV59_21480 [Bacillus sp. MUM 13]
MSIARQDGWTQDEDIILADVVLEHIGKGSTQLRAFEEVGIQMSRTAAACGFRWNSYVRKQYKTDIEQAKKKRKDSKGQISEEERKDIAYMGEKEAASGTIGAENNYLETTKEVVRNLSKLSEEYKLYIEEKKLIQAENDKLSEWILSLVEENNILKNKLKNVEEDYTILLSIMEKARMLRVQEEERYSESMKFQNDKKKHLKKN